mmetsp:Transcript_24859/g.81333  ORF Transcript_24859/g.81333 Transcript_24859/m.81333 type:complete len:282 (-) Transcript_24859:484-1329(-)
MERREREARCGAGVVERARVVSGVAPASPGDGGKAQAALERRVRVRGSAASAAPARARLFLPPALLGPARRLLIDRSNRRPPNPAAVPRREHARPERVHVLARLRRVPIDVHLLHRHVPRERVVVRELVANLALLLLLLLLPALFARARPRALGEGRHEPAQLFRSIRAQEGSRLGSPALSPLRLEPAPRREAAYRRLDPHRGPRFDAHLEVLHVHAIRPERRVVLVTLRLEHTAHQRRRLTSPSLVRIRALYRGAPAPLIHCHARLLLSPPTASHRAAET